MVVVFYMDTETNIFTNRLTMEKLFDITSCCLRTLKQAEGSMNSVRTMRFERPSRISKGHKIIVKYELSIVV